MSSVRIRNEGVNVVVIMNGVAILDVPYTAADQIAREMLAAARRAETTAKAEKVIVEEATLLRIGAPFSLTQDPRLIAEARNEAAHNRDLRRRFPFIVPPEDGPQLGTPSGVFHKSEDADRD
jgi:hypothetical protein